VTRRSEPPAAVGPRRVAAPAAVLAGALALVAAPVALAHGGVVPEAPTVASLVLGWSFDPMAWLPAIAALLLWRAGIGRANQAHPGHPVERRRTASWVAGVAVILVALDSGVARYDTTLFSVHMVQHMLLTMVAPPLLLTAGPITLLLQASSAQTRRRWILPFLHARVIRFLAFPVVAWILFAAVMWGTHFSPLFDASLENPWVHVTEHGLYLVTASLFWWPVTGPDPSPWRMPSSVRPMYVGLQMPQNTFLAVAIYSSTVPLYAHYVTTIRSWGPTPLEDQQLAGGIMWLGGDVAFLLSVILLVAAWMRDEERRTPSEDRRLEPERAAIREREVRLASRLAAEQGSPVAVGVAVAAGAAGGVGGAEPRPTPAPGDQASGGTGASR
jgi:putative copper resistance protein D